MIAALFLLAVSVMGQFSAEDSDVAIEGSRQRVGGFRCRDQRVRRVCIRDRCMGTRTNPIPRGALFVQDTNTPFSRRGCCAFGAGPCQLCCEQGAATAGIPRGTPGFLQGGGLFNGVSAPSPETLLAIASAAGQVAAAGRMELPAGVLDDLPAEAPESVIVPAARLPVALGFVALGGVALVTLVMYQLAKRCKKPAQESEEPLIS